LCFLLRFLFLFLFLLLLLFRLYTKFSGIFGIVLLLGYDFGVSSGRSYGSTLVHSFKFFVCINHFHSLFLALLSFAFLKGSHKPSKIISKIVHHWILCFCSSNIRLRLFLTGCNIYLSSVFLKLCIPVIVLLFCLFLVLLCHFSVGGKEKIFLIANNLPLKSLKNS